MDRITENRIFLDFFAWSNRMEAKYKQQACDIEDVIRRKLNTQERHLRQIMKESGVLNPEP